MSTETETDPVELEEDEALDSEDSPAVGYSALVANRTEQDVALKRPIRKTVVVSWIPITDGTLPSEPNQPYMADNRRFNGKFHYIARYKTSDSLSSFDSFVGPLVRLRNSEFGLLPVPGKRSQTPFKNYEVLAVSKSAVCWSALSPDGNLPQRPVHGILSQSGNIYIGKRDDVGVGMVQKSESWQFYSHKSTEPYAEDFKVLCFVSNS